MEPGAPGSEFRRSCPALFSLRLLGRSDRNAARHDIRVSAYARRMRFRYSRWDGTQDPLGPDLSAADLLDALSEDLLSGQGADRAISRLVRQGMRGRFTGMD